MGYIYPTSRVQSHLSELDETQRNIEPIYVYIPKSTLGEGPEGRGCKEARKKGIPTAFTTQCNRTIWL